VTDLPEHYLHVEDGRVCHLPEHDAYPETSWEHRWKGPGDAPSPGQRIFGHGPHRGSWGGDSRRWPCLREHPAPPDRWPFLAVLPGPHSSAKSVHILLPGYSGPASAKRGRSREKGSHQAMCGHIGVGTVHWSIVTETDQPNGREHAFLSVAAPMIARSKWLRWCPPCLGRTVDHLRIADQVTRFIVEADLTYPEDR
jgi:hypothetical protein